MALRSKTSKKSLTVSRHCWAWASRGSGFGVITCYIKKKKTGANPATLLHLCLSSCLGQRSSRQRQMVWVWGHSIRRKSSNTTLTLSFLALISWASDTPMMPSQHRYWTLWWKKRLNKMMQRQRAKDIWWELLLLRLMVLSCISLL